MGEPWGNGGVTLGDAHCSSVDSQVIRDGGGAHPQGLGKKGRDASARRPYPSLASVPVAPEEMTSALPSLAEGVCVESVAPHGPGRTVSSARAWIVRIDL